MRKYQQRQILELLTTMKEVQTAGLYADCQECAITIGEFIESIEGEGTQTVVLLEEYCELLYKASNSEIGDKPLRKQMIKIENSIKNELKPNRIEMVFLSYKASMSDCLESIYTAAKEDSQTDAYWIPIPYYDLNSDGSFGMMHYEGADYYKPHIECTDWKDYNIEEHHPDVIFSFSPYDKIGRMTSVHPDFYFERLRDLTELLVYVPYFVVSDKVEAPYTKCPGVVYSHLVIVQSEQIRQDFIRDYKELEKLGYSRDKYGAPEEKFVALGSPKFDAVINAKPEDFTLPDAWRRLIVKPDGTKKKTILLNTSITPSLNDSEQYLKKLRFVLETLHKHRDDVILWWRPHPLGRTAFESMNTELLTKYDQLVDDYKQECWGIYDDSPDLHRAITLTDAYYGDWSSLVMLYHMTGKPIMISNPAILDNTLPFEPTSMYVTEDKIWFNVRRINALISMDKDTWIPELVGSFPEESNYTLGYNESLFREPAEIDGVLYFPPFLAEEIAAYSPMKESFTKLVYKRTGEMEWGILSAVAYNKTLFFTPLRYPAIVQLDTITNKLSRHSDWVTQLGKIGGDTSGNYVGTYFGLPHVAGSSIWLACLTANVILEFDMESCKHSIYEIGVKDYRYLQVYYDGTDYWLAPRGYTKTPVIKWNPETGIVKELHEIYNGMDNDAVVSFFPVFIGDYLWLLPEIGEHAVKINLDTDTVSITDEFERGPSVDDAGQVIPKYVFTQTFGDSIYAYSTHTGTLIEYNCKFGERREETIDYPVELTIKLRRLATCSFVKPENEIKTALDCLYCENANIQLVDLISYITDENNKKEAAMRYSRKKIAGLLAENANGTAGWAIYDYIRHFIMSYCIL